LTGRRVGGKLTHHVDAYCASHVAHAHPLTEILAMHRLLIAFSLALTGLAFAAAGAVADEGQMKQAKHTASRTSF
jgi:hypothetical protein